MKNEDVKKLLTRYWDRYFGSEYLLNGVRDLNGIPVDVYKDYLRFLIINFKQDVMLDYLYRQYKEYSNKSTNNKYYFTEKGFERHLSDFGLSTYLITDEQYELCKHVYCDPYKNIRKEERQ